MIRRMVILPKGHRSVPNSSNSAKMGSLIVDPPNGSQPLHLSVKTAHNGDITNYHTQKSVHTHAAARGPISSSVRS